MPKGERTVAELRDEARRHGVSGAWKMRKAELLEALGRGGDGKSHGDGGHARNERSGQHRTERREDRGRHDAKQTHDTKQTHETKQSHDTKQNHEGGARHGSESSRSLQYSQEVETPDEHEERPGRSLVTTNHDVIQQWAEERNARPATVGEREGDRPRVLRFVFGEQSDDDSRLEEISWDDWFGVFDERGLNFIFQEHRSDGRDSNFFRLENPGREDA